jgi:hypothetical protein
MTLSPSDMLEIQTAIDEYERKFPRRPAPTAEVALAWRLGKREWAKRQAAEGSAQRRSPEVALDGEEKPDAMFAQQECNRWVWAWEQFWLRWQTGRLSPESSEPFEGPIPWVRGVLRVGLWGVFAVLVASVFFFGAIVGGFSFK